VRGTGTVDFRRFGVCRRRHSGADAWPAVAVPCRLRMCRRHRLLRRRQAEDGVELRGVRPVRISDYGIGWRTPPQFCARDGRRDAQSAKAQSASVKEFGALNITDTSSPITEPFLQGPLRKSERSGPMRRFLAESRRGHFLRVYNARVGCNNPTDLPRVHPGKTNWFFCLGATQSRFWKVSRGFCKPPADGMGPRQDAEHPTKGRFCLTEA